tara:strand:+ start:645 stop:1646 length:1002 start_codon:yes stop_codon:yes gene_type:complete
MNDYYKILGINPSASQEEIKKTYRKLSKTHHPDMGGNENKFKEISKAYETLGDENKRRNYDHRKSNPFSQFSEEPSMDDIFSSFFNKTKPPTTHGRDLNLKIQVSVEDIYFAKEKKIKYNRKKKCFTCKGSGGEWNTCGKCRGKGRIQMMAGNSFFRQVQSVPCPSCNGRGKIPKNLCRTCSGDGLYDEEQVFTFKLPHGIRPGQRMSYPGYGDESPDGNQGNLFVEILLSNNQLFELEGSDLIYTSPINPLDMLLGTELIIPHFDGPVKIDIPALGKIDKIYMLRGKGMKEVGNWNGNLLVKLKIINPEKLTEEQIKILYKVQQESNFREVK